jgi:hypothetical protein
MDRASDRIRRHSPDQANRDITAHTAEMIRVYSSSPAATEHRLAALAREWDMERALFAMTSVNMLLGLRKSAKNRRWLLWPLIVASFQLQHAIQGWCPPVSILRRFGVRTRQEIDSERVALKALRGDFEEAAVPGSAEAPAKALEAAVR